MRASRPPEPGAIVLGGNYRALGVVRSLGRRGIRVWVAPTDEHRVACASRYAERTLEWPARERDQVAFLLALAEREGLERWVLYPSGDEDVELLARHAEALGTRYLVAAPSREATRIAYDKRETYRTAEAIGVPQPRTLFPAGRADVAAMDVRFPVVLKPAYKAEANRFTAAKAWRVDDREQLVARYDEACGLVDPALLMVQEMIPGEGSAHLSFAAICRDGEVLASASAERLRQQPMDFGKASSYVETVEESDAGAHARRLLAAMRFTGIVEVEFKRDSRDGVPKLLDINARAWGWHTLCTRAGVDFPVLEWQQLHGLPVPPLVARPGVRWVRMSTDLPVVLGELRGRRMSARQYLRSLRSPLEEAIFAADDPLPALVDVPLLAALAVRRSLKARRAAVPLPAPVAVGDPAHR